MVFQDFWTINSYHMVGWGLPSFNLRNINSMASDLMVLPRCYTTLTATWSAEMEGSGTGHMVTYGKGTHCEAQHWTGFRFFKDETPFVEKQKQWGLWWMALIPCHLFFTSFFKSHPPGPCFFFSRYRQRLHRWLSWIFRPWCGYWQPYLSHVVQWSYPLSGSFGAFLGYVACDVRTWCLSWEVGSARNGVWMKLKLHLVWYKKMALRVTGW